MKKNAAVIGAGIGGLAMAIRLACKNIEVDVYEANSYCGGKLSEIKTEGFRFDAGPSLFTMPNLVTELFELANKNPDNYFSYQKLDEICKYFWEDKTTLTAWANVEKFGIEVEKKLGEPKEQIYGYLKNSQLKYEIMAPLFLEKSLHKFNTWISKDALKGYKNMFKLGLFSNLNEENQGHFNHPKLVQLFNRYATYNGSDPYQTPAAMSIIPHLEYNIGAYFPKNGMYDISKSLEKLAIDLGVRFHYNTPVSEILIENKIAKQVVIPSGATKSYDYIISNMDVSPTYKKLMPKEKHPDFIINQKKSGSGLIFYWGINKEFKELGLHNILFSDNYKKEFDYQFNKKLIYEDPTIYINISSKFNKKDAPLGMENWFVLLNAPANSGQDWKTISQQSKINIINKVNRILGVDISKHIVFEEILDPILIQSKTSSDQGALYGNSSNNRFASFFRHPNHSSRIKNLFFVGGSVHPGGGIPLALSSAKICSELLA